MKTKTRSDNIGKEKLIPSYEFYQLICFVTAAEQGSFRKSASVLGIQQSTMSRCIYALEEKLGASLFSRHSGGIRLTYAGCRFLGSARSILQRVQNSAREVAAIGRAEQGRLTIGIFSSLASGFLAELLRTFDSNHAGVRLELINGNPNEHLAAVRQLEIDIAFLTGLSVSTDCETEYLWTERVFVVLPNDHPLASKRVLNWRDIAYETFIVSDTAPGQEIRDYLVQRLARLGHSPDIHLQWVGRDDILSLVAIGCGLTLTSEAATAARFPRVVYRPVEDEVLPFSAVWSPRNDNPAFRRLLSLARSMARSYSDIRLLDKSSHRCNS